MCRVPRRQKGRKSSISRRIAVLQLGAGVELRKVDQNVTEGVTKRRIVGGSRIVACRSLSPQCWVVNVREWASG